MSDSAIHVEDVVDEAGLKEFIQLPVRLHPRGMSVPLLQPQLRAWYRGDHALADQGPVRFLLARNVSGEVVGRGVVHHHAAFDAKIGSDVQLFGLTEFTEPEVLTVLLGEVERHARAAGRKSVIGPAALLPNQTGAVITDGFADRGFVDSPWNPAYYADAFRANGYAEMFTGHTWLCDAFADLDADSRFAFDDARLEQEELTVHRTSLLRFGRDLPVLRSLLNESFAQLPYYTPITAPQLAEQTEGLRFVFDPSLLLWLTRAGEPVAFVWVVPDLSEFIVRHGGKLGVRQLLALVTGHKKYRREAVLIVKGTVPAAQGKGYLTLLSRELLTNLQRGGYRALRSTWVGEDNPASAAQYVRMGGRRLHRTTFYRKDLK